jgi:hypothetical protein
MTNPALKRRAKFSLPLRGSKSESNVAKNQFVQKLKLQTTSAGLTRPRRGRGLPLCVALGYQKREGV